MQQRFQKKQPFSHPGPQTWKAHTAPSPTMPEKSHGKPGSKKAENEKLEIILSKNAWPNSTPEN